MQSEHPHPLLAQVPLTVSPFFSLPTGTTLPYTYKSLPSTLPPSITDGPASTGPSTDPTASTNTTNASHPRAAYVQSTTSHHSAHPDDIIASCRALQSHLQALQDEAADTVKKWEDEGRARELAEKRRVAPGWLDVEEKLLVPERIGGVEGLTSASGPETGAGDGLPRSGQPTTDRGPGETASNEGEELDRAFGGASGGFAQLAFRPK